MTVNEYAGLEQNVSGFWTEKVCVETYRYKYHIYHQGLSHFSDSISESKTNLQIRYDKLIKNRRKAVDLCRKTLKRKILHEWNNGI